MNILFIFSLDHVNTAQKPLYSYDQIQFGISYISALLKQKGYQTNLVILSKLFGDKNYLTIDAYIKKHKPGLICFTTVATEYEFIASIASYIKSKYPDIFLLVGGPHVSLNPETVIKDNFDALCVGEGEYPALELASQLKKRKRPSNIHNLWFKYKNGDIQRNLSRPFFEELESLPFPDRSMWEDWIEISPVCKLSVLLGRGCPFNCTYCSNHALRKVSPGVYVRVRSIKNIIDELEVLAENYPHVKTVHLEIETIGVNKEWTILLAQAIQKFNKSKENRYFFSVNLRITPKTNYRKMFSTFKKAGIGALRIGLESGSEKIRTSILRRVYTNKDIINAVKMAKKLGLQVVFFNLIGVPGETWKDFQKTIRINRICQPEDLMTSIFVPYPGTDLYWRCQEEGLLKRPLNFKMERAKAILNLPGFSKRQIQHAYVWFDYYVYKGYMSMPGIFIRVFRNWCNSSPLFSRTLRQTQIFLWKIGLKNRIKKLISNEPLTAPLPVS